MDCRGTRTAQDADLPADVERDDQPDLAFTWSLPTVGRVRTTDGGRFVAMFGGGFDPDPDKEDSGRTFYMVDVETGKAIYKRFLKGQVAASPSAVDTTGDGFLDVVYFGTTTGQLYKISLRTPASLTIDDATDEERIPYGQWDPLELFDTGGRPIHQGANAIWLASRQQFALAFGTGDRADLWSPQPKGRFYVFADAGYSHDNLDAPFTEAALYKIERGDGDGPQRLLEENLGPDELAGYYIELAQDERLISKPFTLTGVTLFTTFVPNQVVEDGNCKNEGVSNLYTIFTASGNALVDQPGDVHDRYRSVDGFVSDPFAEFTPTQGDPSAPDPEVEEALQDIENKLKGLLPSDLPVPERVD